MCYFWTSNATELRRCTKCIRNRTSRYIKHHSLWTHTNAALYWIYFWSQVVAFTRYFPWRAMTCLTDTPRAFRTVDTVTQTEPGKNHNAICTNTIRRVLCFDSYVHGRFRTVRWRRRMKVGPKAMPKIKRQNFQQLRLYNNKLRMMHQQWDICNSIEVLSEGRIKQKTAQRWCRAKKIKKVRLVTRYRSEAIAKLYVH